MNLKQIAEWASKLDVESVPTKHKARTKCYVDMIILKTDSINNITDKISSYMEDVKEYVEQLHKLGFRFEEEPKKEEAPQLQPTVATKKRGRPRGKSVPKGHEKPEEGKEVLREPGV